MSKPANAKLWIKLTLPGAGQVGPGKVELLRNIGKQRSIAAAARAMGMSYRRAWLLVDEMNQLFNKPVVAKWHGGKEKGGASLTALGEELIKDYDAVVECSSAVNAVLLGQIGRRASRTVRQKKA
ncbi:MAG: hypothetical protein WD795_20395 [Woeseia sp.]